MVDAARPEPLLRDPKAVAALAEHVASAGTRTPVRRTSQCVFQPRPAWPNTSIRRTTSTPGAPVGTRKSDARRCGASPGSVTAMTMPKPDPSAPVENHLCASITQSSPSLRARPASVVGSAPETSGSVIPKNERTSPATSGAQPPLPLLRRAVQRQDLAVAGVRRLAAEDELAPVAAPDLLVQEGVGEEATAGAAGLGADVRRPQPGGARPLPQRRDERVGAVVAGGEGRLVRIDVLVHERGVALAQRTQLRRDRGQGVLGHRAVYSTAVLRWR